MATENKIYVDPDVSGGAGDGTSWANAYSSMNAAEAAEDSNIVTADEIAHFVCHSTSSSADTGGIVYFFGWTTDATRYIKWSCPTADATYGDCRHNGAYDTSKYRLEVTENDATYLREEYIKVEGIQAYCTQSQNYHDTLFVAGISTGEIWISHSIFKCSGSATYNQYGIAINDVSANYRVWDNLIFNGHATRTMGCMTVACSSAWVYNNTCIGGRYAIVSSSGTVYIKNNIGQSHNNGDYSGTFDSSSGRNIGEFDQENLCFGSTVDSGTCDADEANKIHDADQNFLTTCKVGFVVKNTTDTTYSYITAVVDDGELTLADDLCPAGTENYEIYPNFYGSVTFDDEGSDNYHLDAGDTLAAANGYDLDEDGNCPVTDDIDGDTRDTSTPDIGFDELGGAVTYQELNLTIIAAGSASGVDIQDMLELGLTVTAVGSIVGTDSIPYSELGLTVVAAGSVVGTDTVIYRDTGLTVTAAGVVSGADVAAFIDSLTVTAAGVVTGTGIQTYVEAGLTVSAVGVASGTDGLQYIETGLVVTAAGSVSVTDAITCRDLLMAVSGAGVASGVDIAIYRDTGLTVTAVGSVIGTDEMVGAIQELNLTVTGAGVVSGTDVQTYVETGLTVTASGGVSGSDTAARVESGLTVAAAGAIMGVDVATYRDTVTVAAVGVVTGADVQNMVEYNKTVSAVGLVTGSDVLPGVFVVAAFVVLRQVTS